MSTFPDPTPMAQPPPDPPYFGKNQPETLPNYTFRTKDAQPEEDPSVPARLNRLKEQYERYGMRRSCEAILVVHEHNHPHVLMLQIANAFFKLPGDYLLPHEEEITGFRARLAERLSPEGTSLLDHAQTEDAEEDPDDWNVSDCVAQWWRPNFETFMYPFIPAHVTRPKECKKMYLIQMPKRKTLYVPRNMKLLAVPLFELYDNTARYGPQLSAIPHLLSRYNFEFLDEEDNVICRTPAKDFSAPHSIPDDTASPTNNVKHEES